jgi:D-beta-D-heptose 7-phosphate kinase/D-beta-D-heptose 1-phosphate adenosyltransferase
MTPERAQELLRKSSGCRVLLIGDLMMDEWVFGSVRRISPEAPIPIVTMPLRPGARAEKPGGAGNVAAILLALGADVRVVGVTGDDDCGRRLQADLSARGADISGVVADPSRPTTHKLRILAGRQQLLRIDTESEASLEASLRAQLRDGIAGGFQSADVMLVSDYAKGVLTPESLPSDVIEAARAQDIPVCIDPKPANIDLFRGASVVSPNEAESLQAAGINASANADQSAQRYESAPSHTVEAGRILRARLAADAVFITRGDRGITVFGSGETVTDVPALTGSGDVGDTTGCGDAVSAASALALAAGASYVEAAEIGNAAGGVVSRFVGVHNPTAGEIVGRLADSR